MGSCIATSCLIAALLAPGLAAAACAPEAVEVRGAGGVARFSVEIADDPAERARGLMLREKLPSSAGMLFVFRAPHHASFWMKNTLIPLDILFADPAGRVTVVHENAVPQDLTPIDGGDGVVFVLEINGGLARRLGIAPGAVLRHPAIDPAVAEWPCP